MNPLVHTVTCVAGFRDTVNIRNIYHEHAQQSNYMYLYRANGCGRYVCLCFDWCHHSFTEMANFNSIFNRCYFRSVLPFSFPFGHLYHLIEWLEKTNWILPTTTIGFQFETKRESTMNKWEKIMPIIIQMNILNVLARLNYFIVLLFILYLRAWWYFKIQTKNKVRTEMFIDTTIKKRHAKDCKCLWSIFGLYYTRYSY